MIKKLIVYTTFFINFYYDLLATNSNILKFDNEERTQIHFYKADKGSESIYILGSNHILPANILPKFVHEIFEKCPIFYSESIKPINEKDLESFYLSLIDKGYEYNPKNNALKALLLKSSSSLITHEEHLKKDKSCDQQHNNHRDKFNQLQKLIDFYSYDWTNKIKRNDLLKKFMEEYKVSHQTLIRLDPCVITANISRIINLNEEKDGMDFYFLQNAYALKKDYRGLEEASEVFTLRNKHILDYLYAQIPLEITLQELDKNLITLFEPSQYEKDIHQEKIEKAALNYFDKNFQEKYLQYINEHPDMDAVTPRNKLWSEKLKNINEPAFICAGVAHLFGKDSLLNLMKQKGYTITQATDQGFSTKEAQQAP